MDAIKSRGLLVCGVSTGAAGFSVPDSQGVMRGLDADSCRAVATAVLGDPNKVTFVALTTTNRFTDAAIGRGRHPDPQHDLDAWARGQISGLWSHG